MTTAAEVKRLVRPLLISNDDLILVGRLLVVLPVRHLVKGILIGRTRSAEYFEPVPAVNMMFEPRHTFHLTYAIRLFESEKWNLNNNTVSHDLCDVITSKVLSVLRHVNSIDEFDRYRAEQCTYKWPRHNLFPHQRVYISAAVGDFEDAEACFRKLGERPDHWRTRTRTEADFDRLMDELAPLVLRRDRAGIGAFLRDTEAWSAKSLGLEQYWQPSPFPVESEG